MQCLEDYVDSRGPTTNDSYKYGQDKKGYRRDVVRDSKWLCKESESIVDFRAVSLYYYYYYKIIKQLDQCDMLLKHASHVPLIFGNILKVPKVDN